MLEKLKAEVCKANLDLVAEGLVIQTWGNASAVDARQTMSLSTTENTEHTKEARMELLYKEESYSIRTNYFVNPFRVFSVFRG